MIVPPPNYGAFKIGNLPKKGYNKNAGPNPPYIEDPVEDTVTYQKGGITNPESPNSLQANRDSLLTPETNEDQADARKVGA